MSKDHGHHHEVEARQKEKDYMKSRMRKCHDCNKPTWDYRCPECTAKWRKRHGVSPSETEIDE